MSNRRRLWIEELQPGMKLAAPIVYRRHIFAEKNTILTDKAIEYLKRQAETLTVLVEAEHVKRPLTRWERMVRHNYEKSVEQAKKVFDLARTSSHVPISDLVELTSITVNDLIKENYVLQSLKALNNHDEYTYYHSINVGALCGVLGKWLKYDKEMLFMLVLGGILHDIGKTKVPLEILNKPGKLTNEEMEIMKKHPVFGYEMLKDVYNIPYNVKLSALQHHEKINGTGYPFALQESKISDFAKIVAVADTYDAVTSNRAYKEAQSPFALIEIFQQEMFIRLDSKICWPMLSQIKTSLVGRQVIVEDGRRGKIVFIGTQSSDDMIIQTEDDELLTLNLKEHKNFKEYIG